ncbi:MAG: MarR family winged helix-turn-helix transcriptional regulator [Streptosporangiaceae bacterium]
MDLARAAGPVDAGRLRLAIGRLSRLMRRHSVAGLTPTQISTLASVERRGPLRLGDLAAYEGISPSTLSRPVAALEEGGYLERRTDPDDARSSLVATSERGRALLTTIREETTALLAERLELLTAEQRSTLAAALPALEHLADIDQSL